MNTQRTVLLAGASGVFGRHIDRVLTAAGYDVVGLGRGESNEVRADLTDQDAVLRAVDGRHADIVVHAATALAKPPLRHRDMVATDRLRTTGMRNLVDAAREIGAKRIITESMMFGYGYGDFGSTPVTEDQPFAPRQTDPKLEAHIAAMREKEDLTFGTTGLDGIALRFGLFYGPGGTDTIVDALRKRMMPAPKSNGAVDSWVHLEDAAGAVLAAIERGRPGRAYNIADSNPMSFGDHIRATAAAFDTPKPMTVPVWMLRPMGYLNAVLHANLRLDTARARTELGWRPRYETAADGLAAMTQDRGTYGRDLRG